MENEDICQNGKNAKDVITTTKQDIMTDTSSLTVNILGEYAQNVVQNQENQQKLIENKTVQGNQNEPKRTETAVLSIKTTKTDFGILEPQKPIKSQINKEIEFIRSLAIAVNDKFDPIAIYVHAWHETAGYTALVGNYNYCGVKIPRKAIPPVPVKPIEILTHEYINGVSRLVTDIFADFESADDFMRFYIWQVQRLYKMSYENRNKPSMYFYGLNHDVNRWATNPTYDHLLQNIYDHLTAGGNDFYNKLLNKLNY